MASSTYRHQLESELSRSDARSIISVCTLLIADAWTRRASDIHIDPTDRQTRVRLRIDGQLDESYDLPLQDHAELIARLKILARLRTDEHFIPQDGGFKFTPPDQGTSFDIRLSLMPTQHGESAVLRLLVTSEIDSLAELGMSAEQERIVLKALIEPHGLMLIVGPTGSGKTTTLYALLRQLTASGRSIITIEDPIEYSIPGMRQVQVMPKHGLTFAEGLRAILRQDPDVIVVGEVRDTETASLAVQAAHTGHLVLSTLHATSAAGAYARLAELDVAKDRLATLQPLIIAQKLTHMPGVPGRSAEFEFHHA